MIIGNLIFMFTSSVLDRVIWGEKNKRRNTSIIIKKPE
jgi:hypothetical protein